MSEHGLQEIQSQTVTVLGAGAWGIVLAAHLERHGHCVTAWDFSEDVVNNLLSTHNHPNLPDFRIPESIKITNNLESAMCDQKPDCVVVVVPSHGVRDLAERCKQYDSDAQPPWVLCTKGIEENSLLTMDGVVRDVCGQDWRERLAILSGPSFAAEVALEHPTTVCVASEDALVAYYIQTLFMSSRLRVYTQTDVLGVELGGSLKNVIAIAAGVCDGMQLGDNARAALITRGLAEIVRLGVAMGANAATFSGLAGMGDLVLTCGGKLSRNHQFGELLAEGFTCDQALKKIGMVVEGMRTANSVHALAEKHKVEMPICQEIYNTIYRDKNPGQALGDLMGRQARPEMY